MHMIVLWLSIGVTLIISVISVVWDQKPRKVKLALLSLAVLSSVLGYLLLRDDTAEKDKLKKSVDDSKALIEDANKKLVNQAKDIQQGFENLKNQVSSQNINPSILSGLQSLSQQVGQFINESQSFYTSTFKKLDQWDNQPVLRKGTIQIPVKGTSAAIIDSESQVAVEAGYTYNGSEVRLIVNGQHTGWVKPGDVIAFKNESGEDANLLYKGVVNDNYEFTVQRK